ncbi:helix-turn-helix transcriptional regulator [Hyphomonas sp.]|uniref:helix-turn-helix transcriptional regulator n=1 Tax=Hyphomonas sp. TaxID=87 RepID=UPI0039194A93
MKPLPATGYIRQSLLLQYVPFSGATLWRRVKDGTFPAPVKLSANVTAWDVSKVRAWMQSLETTEIQN